MLSCYHAGPGGDSGRSKRGPVAQLGARLNGIEEAGGSNPPRSTKLDDRQNHLRDVARPGRLTPQFPALTEANSP